MMFYLGKIINNDDPTLKGRVRAFVKGRFEPSTDWLTPAATMGDGENDAGGFIVPRIGAQCLVFFADGNFSRGFYFIPNRSGYSIEGEAILVFGDLEIALAEDNAVIFKNVIDGVTVNKIEMQTKTGSMIVKSSAVLNIQATALKIDAIDMTIMGRKVLATGDDI